jgi:hypothetical protein
MKRVHSRGAEELFVLPALLSLVVALAWASIDGQVWSGHFYRNPTIGLVHVFTLGWLSLVIQGVLVRLGPMVLGIKARGRRWMLAAAGLWIVGASGTAAHMVRGEWFGVWTAGVCLWVAALLIPVSYPGLIGLAMKGHAIARYAALAMLHLILAASVGTFIGLNKHLSWTAINPFAMLGAHFHLAEVGWVTFMILGFGRKLVPSLAPSRERDPRTTRLRLLGLELGLLLTVLGLLLQSRALLCAGATFLAIALVLHTAPALGKLFSGTIQDRATFWASVAMLFLVVDALLGLGLAWSLDRWLSLDRDRLLFVYGAIACLGWNTLTITSLALKLFPLWAWQERFEPDWGVRPVPGVKDLYRPWLRELSGVALTVGTVLVSAGILAGLPSLAQWGARLSLAGVLCFVANFVLIARWALFNWPYRPSEEDWTRFHALRTEKDVSSLSSTQDLDS